MPKLLPMLFTAVCVGGASAFIYFAHASALESLPAYSSLNAAPNGAKLLFEALHAAEVVRVSRQFKSLDLARPKHSVVFFLGVEPFTPDADSQKDYDKMAKFARDGNRLIFSYRTAAKLDKTWLPMPGFGPDVRQRPTGKGSIVVVNDAQRLTNKGVAGDKENRQLLSGLLSGYSEAIFDETHLGIRETGSIAGLARHYNLEGLVTGLLLLAGLFIWSRSVAFPPVPPQPADAVSGSDSRAMLASFMSRHLKGQLIATCVAEWNRTRLHAPHFNRLTQPTPLPLMPLCSSNWKGEPTSEHER